MARSVSSPEAFEDHGHAAGLPLGAPFLGQLDTAPRPEIRPGKLQAPEFVQ